MSILREDLLAGVTVALSAASDLVGAELVALGATVVDCDTGVPEVDAIVHDAGAGFGGGGQALMAALEETWIAVAAVANAALIPSGRGGKVVLIGPSDSSGDFAGAARDSLENLARTLSVEWARYGITATAIAPAAGARVEDVALLVAYLLSRAGNYFSGCRLDLAARA
jgi:NAD(P)-dependent dehydrogenase (short-subunit alcohol dehydrogenase family)